MPCEYEGRRFIFDLKEKQVSKVIQELEQRQLKKVPRFLPGDRVKVHFQVKEGRRKRTQVFEGIVLKRQGSGARETFTVRKTSFGVGVQRTFPVHSPKIERIDIEGRGEVKRSKLYYLRGRIGRKARVREQFDAGLEEEMGLYESELAMEQEQEGKEQASEEGEEAVDGDETEESAEEIKEDIEADVEEKEAEPTQGGEEKGADIGESKASTKQDDVPEAQTEEPERVDEQESADESEGNGADDKNSMPKEASSPESKD